MEERLLIKVAGTSHVKAVAGSITKSIESGKKVEVLVVGASALNQATKAIIMARGFLATKGYNLAVFPGFSTTQINGEDKTSIKLVLDLV